jgi:hypothetical protein
MIQALTQRVEALEALLIPAGTCVPSEVRKQQDSGNNDASQTELLYSFPSRTGERKGGVVGGVKSKSVKTKLLTSCSQSSEQIPPNPDDVKRYAVELGLPLSEAEKFMHYWDSLGWQRKTGKVRSWRGSLRLWKSNWQEHNPASPPTIDDAFLKEYDTFSKQIQRH